MNELSKQEPFRNPLGAAMMKSCSIFFYEGYVGIAPTIINLAKILSKNTHQLTIFGTENHSPKPGNLGDNVKTIYFSKESNKLFKFFNKLKINSFGPFAIYALQCLGYEFRGDRSSSSQKNVNIGVDINGGIVAFLYFILFKQNYLFLSLELTDPRKFRAYTGVGMLAKLAYKNSSGVIIQDRARLQILAEYYEYQHPRVFYLPNSPLEDFKLDNINYFRDKFDLSQEQFPHIILQAGWIGDKVCSQALAQAFSSLHNGCALVFHSSSLKTADDPYLKLLKQVNSRNLFLSLEPVDYEEIDKIYASSTIGLAFYTESDPNFSEISMASGKLPQYLKWGKPVLASNLPSLSRLIEQYQCGIIINDPSNSEEIESAIARLLSDYDRYSTKAKICFDSEFNFSKEMLPILEFIERL